MGRFAMLVAALAFSSTVANAAQNIVVHRDPGCPCCAKWAEQVRKSFGSSVQIMDDQDRSAFSHRLGVPAKLKSCHTAIINGMVFEGHVPIADMKRLLAERPKGVRGLAVAGMPAGSPGMEMRGSAEHYSVVAFGTFGQKLYARH